jgi:hypothetical protein
MNEKEYANTNDFKLTRVVVKKECNNFFIAEDYYKNRYKILKNDYSKNFQKNLDDYIRYRIIKKGFFIFPTIIDPISHEDYLKIIGS